jgi:dipicolinate synthase subunit A
MYENINITLLGGDRRHIYAVRCLANAFGKVNVCGTSADLIDFVCKDGIGKISYAENAEDTIKDSKIIVLPVPASSDGVHVSAPLDSAGTLSELKLSGIVRLCDENTVIIGGKLPENFVKAATEKGIRIYDLLGSECFEIANAYITAEASLSIALNSLTVNLKDAKVAVTGFGRISKHLCRLLSLLGARVTVAARKERDIAWAETLGYQTVHINNDCWSDALTNGYNIIYNTVPSVIFGRDFLSKVDRDTLLIELASVPGGFDICAARELGANISWALSLPGKYAPESAGAIIAENVLKILGEVVL